jgi:hypothetical protein
MSESITPLKVARLASGFTISEAARAAGIRENAYRLMEEGLDDEMTIGDIKRMLPYLNGISVHVLHDWMEGAFIESE